MGGDLLSENKISSHIFYTACFASCISGPLDVPKGCNRTPTVTTQVKIFRKIGTLLKQFLGDKTLKLLMKQNNITVYISITTIIKMTVFSGF